MKIFIEGIQVKKFDGSKASIKLQPSNLQIIELNMEDKKRFGHSASPPKKEEKENVKKQAKKEELKGKSKK